MNFFFFTYKIPPAVLFTMVSFSLVFFHPSPSEKPNSSFHPRDSTVSEPKRVTSGFPRSRPSADGSRRICSRHFVCSPRGFSLAPDVTRPAETAVMHALPPAVMATRLRLCGRWSTRLRSARADGCLPACLAWLGRAGLSSAWSAGAPGVMSVAIALLAVAEEEAPARLHPDPPGPNLCTHGASQPASPNADPDKLSLNPRPLKRTEAHTWYLIPTLYSCFFFSSLPQSVEDVGPNCRWQDQPGG